MLSGAKISGWKAILLLMTHILLWTSWTLSIRSTQVDGRYPYSFSSVILATETWKILITLVLYFFVEKGEQPAALSAVQLWEHRGSGVLFLVPATLYQLYNFLYYINMTYFDAASYRVLINIRVLLTGVLVNFLFPARRLSRLQWLALALLAFGCALNQLGDGLRALQAGAFPLGMVVVQGFLSSLAGVYSEYLLKSLEDMSLNVKNLYLYCFTLSLTLVYVLATEGSVSLVGWTPATVGISLLGALCGFSTALFLSLLHVVLKEYAHSAEIIVTAVASYILLGEPDLTWNLLSSITIVCASVYIYNKKFF